MLDVAGLGLLVAAAAQVSVGLGLAAGGAAALLLARQVDGGDVDELAEGDELAPRRAG